MKKRTFITIVVTILIFSLSLGVSAELREPARENMEKVLELGYDLDSMPTKIVRFEKGLPIFFDETKDDITNGDWELWYIDDKDGLKNFKKDPQNAKFIASQEAMYGEEGIQEFYTPHPDVPGIYIAGIVFAEEEVDKSYTYIDPQKVETVKYYDHTLVTHIGDCDLSATIDLKDVLCLRRRIANLAVREVDEQLFDANNDKNIDLKDVLLLRQVVGNLKSVATLHEYEFDVKEFTKDPKQTNGCGEFVKTIDCKVQYIRSVVGRGKDENTMSIITSVEELEKYYEQNKEIYKFTSNKNPTAGRTIGFDDAIENYNHEFFEKNDLLMIELEETSGSHRHEVTSIDLYDSTADRAQYFIQPNIKRLIPPSCTCDMAYWHIIIEIPKEYGNQYSQFIYPNITEEMNWVE